MIKSNLSRVGLKAVARCSPTSMWGTTMRNPVSMRTLRWIFHLICMIQKLYMSSVPQCLKHRVVCGTCFHCPDHENAIVWIDFVTSRRVTLRRWLSRCACVREAEGRGKPWLSSLWVASGWQFLVRPHRWKTERRICAGCSPVGMIPTTLSSLAIVLRLSCNHFTVVVHLEVVHV
jgi:hypothetical protein